SREKQGRQSDKSIVATNHPPKPDDRSAIAPQPPPGKVAGRPPQSENEPVLEQRGDAAYYADKYQGRTTASGESMDQNELTAASKALPLGAHATVTHLANGKSVDVVVNDRGPNVEGRAIDLSKAAAQQLGMEQNGIARVLIEARPSQQPNPELRDKVFKAAQARVSDAK
ncbi:MAG TPA: septal ring lytic transglycosylase RlpA family protein, partial [Acetobacteraceae bacterium]|nr:septal ring lytic transglycosylase RlpA family protein [Acetobacteraceae bacterium]